MGTRVMADATSGLGDECFHLDALRRRRMHLGSDEDCVRLSSAYAHRDDARADVLKGRVVTGCGEEDAWKRAAAGAVARVNDERASTLRSDSDEVASMRPDEPVFEVGAHRAVGLDDRAERLTGRDQTEPAETDGQNDLGSNRQELDIRLVPRTPCVDQADCVPEAVE